MKKLPIGLQNFKEIIEYGYLYVDKTRQIYDLVDKGKLYFLSRPRRFGKSLMLSTLRYIFEGEKDLFEGLYIAEQTDYDWKKHPVLEFNFAIVSKETASLERGISYILQDYAQQYGVEIPDSDIRLQFNFLVKRIAEKQTGRGIIQDVGGLFSYNNLPHYDFFEFGCTIGSDQA